MLLLASCLVLAGGFIFAVSRHILAVDYGYKTEALRREREQLLDEQHRLLVAVEEGSSPARLEQAGRELGMQPARASQIETSTPREVQRGTRVFMGTGTGTILRR
jgi:hypothetical protein